MQYFNNKCSNLGIISIYVGHFSSKLGKKTLIKQIICLLSVSWRKQQHSHSISIMSKTDKIPANFRAEKTLSKPVILQCIPCSLDNRKCDAHCFCVQCIEHLCADCAKDHRKIKLTRNHVLLEGKEMPKDSTAFEEMAKLTLCKVHQDRDVEFCCSLDNKLICALCLRDEHRACKHVVSVNKLLYGKKIICEGLLMKCVGLKHLAEKKHKKAIARVHDTDHTTEIEKQIPEFVKELENMAHLFNTDIKKAILQSKKDKADIPREVSKLELFISRLNTHITVSEFTIKFGSDVQLFILARSLAEFLFDDDIEEESEMLIENRSGSDPGVASLSLGKIADGIHNVQQAIKGLRDACSSVIDQSKQPVLNPEVAQVSGKGENEVIKKVVTKDVGTQIDNDIVKPEPSQPHATSDEKEQGACKYSDQSETEISSESVYPLLFESQIQYVAKHDVSVDTQNEPCSHTRCFVLKNGFMIILDKENNILKHVSSTYEVIHWYTYSGDSEIRDVVNLSDHLVGIAHEDMIETLCVCLSCESFHDVEACPMYSSVCSIMPLYDDDNYVDEEDDDVDGNDDEGNYGGYASDSNNNGSENEYENDNDDDDDEDDDDVSTRLAILYSDRLVKFRNKNIRLERKFWKYKRHRLVPFHLRSPFMIRARNKDEFIVAEENRVTVFERGGTMKWFYKMDDSEQVNFITYDTEGNIYICDTDSNKIHQISSESNKSSRKSRVIISDLEKPSSVLFNPVNRTLVVGCMDDDCVYTYKFG